MRVVCSSWKSEFTLPGHDLCGNVYCRVNPFLTWRARQKWEPSVINDGPILLKWLILAMSVSQLTTTGAERRFSWLECSHIIVACDEGNRDLTCQGFLYQISGQVEVCAPLLEVSLVQWHLIVYIAPLHKKVKGQRPLWISNISTAFWKFSKTECFRGEHIPESGGLQHRRLCPLKDPGLVRGMASKPLTGECSVGCREGRIRLNKYRRERACGGL